jgi:hypothetical protein
MRKARIGFSGDIAVYFVESEFHIGQLENGQTFGNPLARWFRYSPRTFEELATAVRPVASGHVMPFSTFVEFGPSKCKAAKAAQKSAPSSVEETGL